MNKRRCLRLDDHEFYSFDISGHAFLMSYGIFTIMEESKELIYVLCLGQFLRKSNHCSANPSSFSSSASLILSDEEPKIKPSSSLSIEDVALLRKKYAVVVPCVVIAALLAVCLSLLWDFSFLITTLYYHSFPEKLLALFISIGTWYLVYPLLLTSLDIL